MTNDLETKAARMTCVGFFGATLDDELRSLLDLGVGGVVLYPPADITPEGVAALIASIKTHAKHPLFIAIDHEGGDYSRLHVGFTELPPMRALGDTRDAKLARAIGGLIGRELRAVGVDVCLGPVLDVATNPKNPIIGNRSLGADPRVVAELGTALASGLQEAGVAACGKHFPGHGDTSQDSNVALPSLPHDMARLESVELPPFEAAVHARMPAISAAHVLFTPLDRVHPASISRAVLFGLLRQRMGYRGVVICDDVDMAAVEQNFGYELVAVEGTNASVDCFLCARRPASAHAIVEAIVAGVRRGDILQERVESAGRRLAALLHRYARPAVARPDLGVLRSKEHLELAQRLFESEAHRV
jgi:beta-N-acetylhexosaminidase